ncbi:unnamed protein product [Allacma fusca]|uniref:DM13 domain-containing protein n=1 Tax=Allacma fusca TaxID=39272 RepID=A0A8J2M972_9HEXA|nr:unnamed protein product [Allacma fusca]
MSHLFALVVLTFVGAAHLTTADRINLGSFRGFAHGVKSGNVYILDDKTIEIQNYHYDGAGPAAWFVVGRDNKYTQEYVRLPYMAIVPDENGSCSRPQRYWGKTLRLSLPGKFTTADISYLSMYCIKYGHNFGYVSIPNGIRASKSRQSYRTRECQRPRE